MATLEQFRKVFAPLIIMEEHMSDLQTETGYISKVLVSQKNAQWRGFLFQGDDDKAYSITLNDKVPADLRSELAILGEKDYVTLHYKPSDCGKYFNIKGLERPEKQQDAPSNDKPSPTPPSNGLDGMTKCNVTNNGTLIYCELIKTGTLPDREVLIQLFDEIAGWHRKNGG